MQFFTLTREIDDLYNPDPDAMITVEIDVSFSIGKAEPDIGIPCDYIEELFVESTSSELFDTDDAQRWLDSGSKEAEREIEYLLCQAEESKRAAWEDFLESKRVEP